MWALRKLTVWQRSWLLMSLLLTSQVALQAQSTNGTYTVVSDIISSAGGAVGSGNPMSVQTAVGVPAGGSSTNGTYSLIGGFVPLTSPASTQPVTHAITVTGTASDASGVASVIVTGLNAVTATIVGTTFTASNVLLQLGANTITVEAKDNLGNRATKTITVYLDLPAAQKTPAGTITVRGTVSEPDGAQVWVNNVAAVVDPSGAFTASNVPLVFGLNTLTATGKDAAGNDAAPKAIRVFAMRPTNPPARPTLESPPGVVQNASIELRGTKTAGTSIWINGREVVALSDETTWSATVSLVEGDNEFTIVAKDARGTSSTQVTTNVVVDNLPPVITFVPPAKTNLNPFVLRGSVDDSLTRVMINGQLTSRTQRTFELSVPLVLGLNTVVVEAISPNNYQSNTTRTIELGMIPTIQAVQPAEGTTPVAGSALTIQVTAVDRENDPMQYQFLLGAAVLRDWTAVASHTWLPDLAQLGLKTLTVKARDDYGGEQIKDVEVFVVRPPIQHP